jgi:hypothetical protein
MSENPRFHLVFTKLRLALDKENQQEAVKPGLEVCRISEATREELDEIDILRRIVLEVTDSEPISFTTT